MRYPNSSCDFLLRVPSLHREDKTQVSETSRGETLRVLLRFLVWSVLALPVLILKLCFLVQAVLALPVLVSKLCFSLAAIP